jgi:hypothetical protein
MTLIELSYLILESIRDNKIVDDEKIDLRLIQDWIIMKRSDFLRQKSSNNFNPNKSINLNNYQTLPLTVAVGDSFQTSFNEYPFDDSEDPNRQLRKIVTSAEDIPAIIEDKQGPMIYSLEDPDLMKLPFSYVSYDHMRVAGNGKFNSNLIFGTLRDNKVYFKYNTYFDTYTSVVLRAIFEDPRQVTGYDIINDRFPVSGELLEAIKNSVFDKDFRVILMGVSDNINDASGEINRQ